MTTNTSWMKLPTRALSDRENNIGQVAFEKYRDARTAAEEALNQAQRDHRNDVSKEAPRAVIDAEDARDELAQAEEREELPLTWVTAMRLAYRVGILAYAKALADSNPARATAVLLREMMDNYATDEVIAAELEKLLTDGVGTILGNKAPGCEPIDY